MGNLRSLPYKMDELTAPEGISGVQHHAVYGDMPELIDPGLTWVHWVDVIYEEAAGHRRAMRGKQEG